MTDPKPAAHPAASALFDPAPGVITVWSDLACPWATLALHNLREAAARIGVGVSIDLRAFPLELINERPTPKAVVDAETAVIGSVEPALGWRPWNASLDRYPVTTLLGLEAVQAAKDAEVGGPVASAALDAALRRAFFGEYRCISLFTEVVAVARECPEVDAAALADRLRRGSHRARVFDDLAVARGPRVSGSPHVFLPDGSDHLNPGIEVEAPSDHRAYPRITRYDPTVWDSLLRQATADRTAYPRAAAHAALPVDNPGRR